ncbi:MAG: hypothetical protein A2091_01875 [Desulfuromonadales bacterium GWD2_61_12]|nr:MAG: hypothetical protein A2005_06060 [Desulfuromonadales bacterium GWC2_61_20]OGR35729.1 MAG: hypothetical protein A2091_01875 [Desulfuromonadales bacterium GWD2_61_12]
MEAICKPDYMARLKAKADAETALRRRKQKLERAQQRQQLAEKRGWKIKLNEHIEEEAKGGEVSVPEIDFYDIYEVWFHGRLVEELQFISRTRFGAPIGDQVHVYLSIEPKKIADGTHDLTVYGLACRLYKWTAQGYHRGVVVLAHDVLGNEESQVYLESRTWSWMISLR